MALLKFNHQSHEIKVEVGLLEEYQPDREIKRIFNKLERLKENAAEKVYELTKTEDREKAREKLKKKAIQTKWKKYLKEEYNPELQEILDSIHKKNKKLCQGYKEEVADNK